MSAVNSYPQEPIDRITLASLLTPMLFKTVLLVACGLKKCEIAELLGTRGRVIENELRDIYDAQAARTVEIWCSGTSTKWKAAYWNLPVCGGNWKNLRLAQHRFSWPHLSCSDAKASQHLAS